MSAGDLNAAHWVDPVPFLKQMYFTSLLGNLTNAQGREVYRAHDEFPVDPDGLIRRTSIQWGEGSIPELEMPGCPERQRAGSDSNNSVRVHQALSDLTPMQATDQRFWGYLSHAPFFAYTKWRWPLAHASAKGGETETNQLRSRWFGIGRGGLRRNSIARLWWAAHLTFAPWRSYPDLGHLESDDGYSLTRVLWSNQDVYQGILERSYGRSGVVRACALHTIRDYTREQSIGQFAKPFMKAINILCKSTELSNLPGRDLTTLFAALADKVSARL